MSDTNNPVRWTAKRAVAPPPWPVPGLAVALLRGLRGRCPACGRSRLFRGYLRVAASCPACAAPLGRVRADDAPPYFTIFIVGHLIVAGMLTVERAYAPPLWLHAAIWLPLTVILAAALLRPVKGATVGLMLTLGLVRSGDDD